MYSSSSNALVWLAKLPSVTPKSSFNVVSFAIRKYFKSFMNIKWNYNFAYILTFFFIKRNFSLWYNWHYYITHHMDSRGTYWMDDDNKAAVTWTLYRFSKWIRIGEGFAKWKMIWTYTHREHWQIIRKLLKTVFRSQFVIKWHQWGPSRIQNCSTTKYEEIARLYTKTLEKVVSKWDVFDDEI